MTLLNSLDNESVNQSIRLPPRCIGGFRFESGKFHPSSDSPLKGLSRCKEQTLRDSANATHSETSEPLIVSLNSRHKQPTAGPGPQTYSPPGKPPAETNAPQITFGRKCYPDKGKVGGRTSFEKTWFTTSNVWSVQVDFLSNSLWPSPVTYKQQSFLDRQPNKPSPPKFSFGKRPKSSKNKLHNPSPNTYDFQRSLTTTKTTAPAFSLFKRENTVLWNSREKTPGPARYTPVVDNCRRSSPLIGLNGKRYTIRHELGPYMAI